MIVQIKFVELKDHHYFAELLEALSFARQSHPCKHERVLMFEWHASVLIRSDKSKSFTLKLQQAGHPTDLFTFLFMNI